MVQDGGTEQKLKYKNPAFRALATWHMLNFETGEKNMARKKAKLGIERQICQR